MVGIFKLLLLILNLSGVLVLDIFILDRLKIKQRFSYFLYLATFIVTFFFLIYAQVIITGTFSLFNIFSLTLLNGLALFIIGLRRPAIFSELRNVLRSIISEQFRQNGDWAPRAYLWLIVLLVGLYIVKPMNEGDSLGYHLPNTMYFMNSHSTSTFEQDYLMKESALATYFTRGMEAIYAFFFLFVFSTIPILLLKLLLFFLIYFCLLDYSQNRRATLLTCLFLFSTYCFKFDLSSLKNDLIIGALIVYIFVLFYKYHKNMINTLYPIIISLALIGTIKSNGFLLVFPIFVFFVFLLKKGVKKLLVTSLLILLPFGLYFYILNTVRLGSPLYPFSVSLGRLKLFPGQPACWTFLIPNLKASLIIPFFRGLIRATNPLIIFILPWSAVMVSKFFFKLPPRSRIREITIPAFFLMLTFLFVIAHPLLGTEKQWPEHFYSGFTIRYGFSFILIWAALFSRALNTINSLRESRVVVGGTILLCLVNLLWYHLFACILKPGVAFDEYAPVFQIFNNNLLLLLTALLYLIIMLMVISRYRKFLIILFLLFCIAFTSATFPHQIGYSGYYKALNVKSDIFDFLPQIQNRKKTVGIPAFWRSSTFLLRQPLLTYFSKVKCFHQIAEVSGYDYIILGMNRQEKIMDRIHGRRFTLEKPEYKNEKMLLRNYDLIYQDKLYWIYQKNI